MWFDLFNCSLSVTLAQCVTPHCQMVGLPHGELGRKWKGVVVVVVGNIYVERLSRSTNNVVRLREYGSSLHYLRPAS